MLTYSQFLLNLTAVVRKNQSTLQTNKNLRELFQEHPITAFKRNKNLKEVIRITRIENGKVKKFNIPSGTAKYTPRLSGARPLYCNQLLTTNTFMSQEAKQLFNIFFNLNCKIEYVIYLMECILCKRLCVEKAETTFNIRLNNHRKDTKKPNSILACKHFQENGHNFNKHAKFIIIDKLVNLHSSKEALREMLVITENFWIQKLKALVPFGRNQELSKQKRLSCCSLSV